MTFKEKLLQLRKSKGLSQEDLAAQISVSRQSISRWESGISMPDTENIVQLCKIFGVTADYLINDDYKSDFDTPIVQNTCKKMKKSYKRIAVIAIIVTIFSILGLALVILSANHRIRLLGLFLCGLSLGGGVGYFVRTYVYPKSGTCICLIFGMPYRKNQKHRRCLYCGSPLPPDYPVDTTRYNGE